MIAYSPNGKNTVRLDQVADWRWERLRWGTPRARPKSEGGPCSTCLVFFATTPPPPSPWSTFPASLSTYRRCLQPARTWRRGRHRTTTTKRQFGFFDCRSNSQCRQEKSCYAGVLSCTSAAAKYQSLWIGLEFEASFRDRVCTAAMLSVVQHTIRPGKKQVALWKKHACSSSLQNTPPGKCPGCNHLLSVRYSCAYVAVQVVFEFLDTTCTHKWFSDSIRSRLLIDLLNKVSFTGRSTVGCFILLCISSWSAYIIASTVLICMSKKLWEMFILHESRTWLMHECISTDPSGSIALYFGLCLFVVPISARS